MACLVCHLQLLHKEVHNSLLLYGHWSGMCTCLCINHISITAYNPQANWFVEHVLGKNKGFPACQASRGCLAVTPILGDDGPACCAR